MLYMGKLILLISKVGNFDEGTLLKCEGGKLMDFENGNESMDYNIDIIKSGIEISSDEVDKLKSFTKFERCSSIETFKIMSDFDENYDSDLSNLWISDMFLTNTNVKECIGFSFRNDKKEGIFTLVYPKGIYGFIICTYKHEQNIYYFMQLLEFSLMDFSKTYPNCLFMCKRSDSDCKGVLVKLTYVEGVMHNLIFEDNSPYIKYIFNRETCNCGKYKSGDFVKIKKTSKYSIIGKVIECLKINDQHCLLIQPDNEEENREYIVQENDAIKKVPKEITKYFEGVFIEPTSIRKMEDITYNSLEADDEVEVTLRESFQLIRLVVVWIGMLNDVKVAAVKNNSSYILPENLMFCGKYSEKEYFTEKCYLVALSAVRLISSDEMIIKREAVRIHDLIKKNEINVINEILLSIHKKLPFLSSISNACLNEIFKFSKSIFKKFKREILPKKELGGFENNEILDNLKVVLQILCDLSYEKDDIAGKILSDKPLMEILEHVYNELDSFPNEDNEIKDIFESVMNLFWNIIKSKPQLSEVWQAKMITTFNRSTVSANIKLLAALNVSLLAKETFPDISNVTEFLKDTLQQRKEAGKSINDVYVALGKIWHLLKLSSLSDYSQSCETCSAFEESLDEHSFNAENYEQIIKQLVKGYTVCEGNNELLKKILGLKNKDIFCDFIEKQDSIPLDNYLFSKIESDLNMLKKVLRKCTVHKDLYIDMIRKAKDYLNNDKEVTELILNKMEAQPGGEFDQDFLDLAYTSKSLSHDTIFNNALSKCTNINSNMKSGETFLTRMIKDDNVTEEEIKNIIDLNKFDIKVPNKKGDYLIKCAFERSFITLFQLVYKDLNEEDIHKMLSKSTTS